MDDLNKRVEITKDHVHKIVDLIKDTWKYPHVLDVYGAVKYDTQYLSGTPKELKINGYSIDIIFKASIEGTTVWINDLDLFAWDEGDEVLIDISNANFHILEKEIIDFLNKKGYEDCIIV